MNIYDLNYVQNMLNVFASAGGGGSSSGSGDGGVFVLLGYLPTHFVGAFFRKRMHNPLGLILTAIITLVYAGIWLFAGWFGGLVALAALLGGPAGYFGWFSAIAGLVKKSKKAKADIAKAASLDPTWDEQAIATQVQNVFLRFQYDWSTFNVESMRMYIAQPYMYHVELILYGLKLRGRRNDMQNVQITQMMPVEISDTADNSQDRITYYIEAQAQDSIIETIDGAETNLFTNKNGFSELWHMVRSGNSWLLESIEQTTAFLPAEVVELKKFAAANSMYFSLDWGWLLLPRRGDLFKNGAFGTSDINNHVIGAYNNLLVEIYTFTENPSFDKTKVYTIAQAALPKRYGSIIVRAKESWANNLFGFANKPNGYNKISLEWPDFNKRYNVYATDIEQITAFELLHPVYMEKLFALPFRVSIEVVDNVVYLYSTDKKADYGTMLSLLKDAFKEMRL